MMLKTVERRIRKLHPLTKCLLISLFLHMCAVVIFFNVPLVIKSAKMTLFQSNELSSSPITVEAENEYTVAQNKKIADFFSTFAPNTPPIEKPFDLQIPITHQKYTPSEEIIASDIPLSNPLNELEVPDPLFSYSLEEDETPLAFSLHEYPSPELSDHRVTLDETKLNLTDSLLNAATLLDIEEEAIEYFTDSNKAFLNTLEKFEQGEEFLRKSQLLSSDQSLHLPSVSPSDAPFIEETRKSQPLYNIPQTTKESIETLISVKNNSPLENEEHPLSFYNILDKLAVVSWNDQFDIETAVSLENGKQRFAIHLKPVSDMIPWQMKQNFYFLIDRSNSIEKHRFNVFKKGVIKALSSLEEGDRFNIVLFDNKITTFSQYPVAYSSKTHKEAEKFLEKQQCKGAFSATDIYEMLPKVLPTEIPEDEIHSAILISDGNTLNSTSRQKELLTSWFTNNKNKIDLHTAAVGRDNDLLLLDLISTISKGNLFYSDTHASFPRKFAEMIKTLKSPIAKNVIATAATPNESSHITLHGGLTTLPPFYANRPYTIYGEATDTEEFTLLLQAKHADQIVTMKKTINLKQASRPDATFEKRWNVVKAHEQYESFLNDGQDICLNKARDHLTSAGHVASLK